MDALKLLKDQGILTALLLVCLLIGSGIWVLNQESEFSNSCKDKGGFVVETHANTLVCVPRSILISIGE